MLWGCCYKIETITASQMFNGSNSLQQIFTVLVLVAQFTWCRIFVSVLTQARRRKCLLYGHSLLSTYGKSFSTSNRAQAMCSYFARPPMFYDRVRLLMTKTKFICRTSWSSYFYCTSRGALCPISSSLHACAELGLALVRSRRYHTSNSDDILDILPF